MTRDDDAPLSVRTLRGMGRLAWLPLAVGLLAYPTVEFTVFEANSTRSRFFGAPAPWATPSATQPGASEIFLGPLAIDIAIYLGLAFALVRLWPRRPFLRSGLLDRLLVALAWFWGVFAAGLLASTLLMGVQFHPWYDPAGPVEILSVSVAFTH